MGYLHSRFPEWTQAKDDIQMEPKLGSFSFFFLLSKKKVFSVDLLILNHLTIIINITCTIEALMELSLWAHHIC